MNDHTPASTERRVRLVMGDKTVAYHTDEWVWAQTSLAEDGKLALFPAGLVDVSFWRHLGGAESTLNFAFFFDHD
jgi:hypothetical protein